MLLIFICCAIPATFATQIQEIEKLFPLPPNNQPTDATFSNEAVNSLYLNNFGGRGDVLYYFETLRTHLQLNVDDCFKTIFNDFNQAQNSSTSVWYKHLVAYQNEVFHLLKIVMLKLTAYHILFLQLIPDDLQERQLYFIEVWKNKLQMFMAYFNIIDDLNFTNLMISFSQPWLLLMKYNENNVQSSVLNDTYHVLAINILAHYEGIQCVPRPTVNLEKEEIDYYNEIINDSSISNDQMNVKSIQLVDAFLKMMFTFFGDVDFKACRKFRDIMQKYDEYNASLDHDGEGFVGSHPSSSGFK